MEQVILLALNDLEKVGVGAVLMLTTYISNMGLGAWKSCKVEGFSFNWALILNSVYKFIVLGISIGLLSLVISIVPYYVTYVGIEIDAELMDTISNMVIISAFMGATIHYIVDAISKIKAILGINMD